MTDARDQECPLVEAGLSENSRWRKALLPAGANLRDAIRNLDESGLQISLAVSNDGILIGTLTDGDIRRALLRGLEMDSSVESIIQREPLVVPPNLDGDSILQIMRANLIHQVPIVDASRRVVGLSLLDDLVLPQNRSNTVVIMAGGQGRRMRPLTEHCPKPLLPVYGKPILQHIIERARSDGFRHFVLAINYLGEMIEDHFGDGSSLQVEIEYIREETPLGTAGAVALMNTQSDAPVLVSNGDVLADVSYGELLDFHCRHEAVATMAVRLHEWQNPFGVVKTQGVDIVGFEEKPVARSHVNAGIYALDPQALDLVEAGVRCDMPALFNKLRQRGDRTIVYPMHEPWMDVGSPEDYVHANKSDETAPLD